ncbi:hypothetical protein C8R43DRAFT_543616 [Mycena crocata]|nr:hypothetical protein C8R43DRAFT_543616 [Mycena crocata]
MSSEDLILLPAPQFERARQRLEFWASDEIAPHVIDCSVEPLEFEHSGRAPAPGEDPYALLTPFFEFLPRFVNLKSFNAFTVHFSSVTLARFFLLPALSSVSIDMCVLARPEEVLEAPPKVLNLTRFLICNTEDQIDWWFRALCPDALRVVAVDMSGSYDQRFFFEMQPTFPFLPNVHTLTLSLGKMVAPLHLITLSKFPGVKRLKLLKWHHLNGMVPVAKPPELGDSELCPLLQEYIGPFEILKLLPIPAGLRRVIIDHCALDEFLAAMRVVSTSNEIQQLEITTLGYAIPLAELVDMFPELKVFVLTVQGRGWMDVAQDSLPPLVKLVLRNFASSYAIPGPCTKSFDQLALLIASEHCQTGDYLALRGGDGSAGSAEIEGRYPFHVPHTGNSVDTLSFFRVCVVQDA